MIPAMSSLRSSESAVRRAGFGGVDLRVDLRRAAVFRLALLCFAGLRFEEVRLRDVLVFLWAMMRKVRRLEFVDGYPSNWVIF